MPTTVARPAGSPSRKPAAPAAGASPATAVSPPVPRPRLAGGAGGRAGRGRGFAAWLRDRFRLPGRRDPAPHPGRLIGVCTWAACLALLGLPVAGRSSVAIITGAAPAWFEPAVVTVGVCGILLTIAAFAAIHRPRLPWLLLIGATVPLAVNLSLTLTL